MPNWKKEQECFDKAIITVNEETFNQKTGTYKTEKNKKIGYPRPKPLVNL